MPEVELDYRPHVSVLVACHDEALVVESLVRGLAALHYPRSRLEILLVDDGSDRRHRRPARPAHRRASGTCACSTGQPARAAASPAR